jgi:hypothetical protein
LDAVASSVRVESERTDGRERYSYSRIPLNFVLQYRTALSRQTDLSGTVSWTARLLGMPRIEATGSTRAEALQRVREMAIAKGPASLHT